MAPTPDPALIEVARRIADGEEIQWPALVDSRPELAAPLLHLQRLQSLSVVCRTAAGRWDDSGASEPPAIRHPNARKARPGRDDSANSWGPLTLLEKVGEGSFGEVYRAFDRVLQRDVALKLRRPLSESEQAGYRRHLDEARLLARVQHPNVLSIHGVEVHDGRPGMWTDFIEGETLEKTIAATARGEAAGLPAEEIARVGVILLQALGAVHASGLIHGDVKTSNVMRRKDGRIVLMDFGAGRSLDSVRAGARNGAAGAEGTPVYMAPELLRGEPPTCGSDLYAVGVLLYRLATGRHPIHADNLADLIAKAETSSGPIPLRELRPDLPPTLASPIERLLRTQSSERPGGAAEVETELSIAFGLSRAAGEMRPVHEWVPVPTHPIVGRRNELLNILRAFHGARLVTLHGPGGAGKTRLAIECAQRMASFFPETGSWVDLAGLPDGSDAEIVAQEFLRALESRPLRGESLLSSAARALGEKKCLLVIDNAEHVADGCRAVVQRVVEACPELRVLVTSREPLEVEGEVRVPLGAMDCPPETGGATAASILEFDAARLFLDRAHQHRPDLILTNENAPAVASICRTLDGLPLALELVAARTKSLSPAELAARLKQDLAFVMTTRSAAVDSHHETLRGCVDWSYRLLSAAAQRLLARLSVFRGGWTLEAAERVGGHEAGDGSAHALLDGLEELVERSLVVFEPLPGAGGPGNDRYRLLESVRAYAAEQLVSGPDASDVRLAHLRFFQEMAETAEKQFQGPEQQTWMARVRRDHENFEAALATAIERPEMIEDAMRIAACLGRYWLYTGMARHGQRWAERILAIPVREPTTKHRASLLSWAGNLHESNSDFPASIAAHEESCRISESLADRRGVAVALSNMANPQFALGNWSRGRECAARSCEIMEDLADKRGTAYSLNTMARAEQALGDHDSAIRLLERSWALQRELGDGLGAALALHNAAVSLLALERYGEAEPKVLQALSIRRGHGFRAGVASSVNLLASIFVVRGQLDDAERCIRECLALRRELQLVQGLIEVMDKFAIVAFRRGDLGRASVILGMIDGQRERLRIPAPPENLAKMRKIAEDVAATLGHHGYSLGSEHGRLMTLDQATDYLLSDASAAP